jgi:UDP-GlcNAc:undecaprenyl-phosphate GlcNAc-1-phosphate transferase
MICPLCFLSLLSMSFPAFFSHLTYGILLCALSTALTWFTIHRLRIMDVPNQRSSHEAPTPKSGGISIVVTFLIGVLALFIFADKTMIRSDYFLGFIVSALLIAAIGFYDDIKNKPFAIKLATQVVAVVIVLTFALVVDEVSVPFVGMVSLGVLAYPVSFVWILGLTNAYNFMDGIDGLAGGIAVIVSAFFCAITFSQGSTFVYITCYTILAGSLGFLVYNFPPARIFMGDVGSAFLGFVFAVLAIIAARYDHSHTSFLVMPLLLLGFIYDTFFTFVRRLLRGERVFQAHRTHLYQLFSRLGYSQKSVTLVHYAMCVLQGLAAAWMVAIPGGQRMFVFVPFLFVYGLYSYLIIRAAKREGLLGSSTARSRNSQDLQDLED